MAVNENETMEQMTPAGMRVSQDEEIARVINARYSINDQIALLRQKDTKPEEYEAFFAFAEAVKAKVKAARAAEEEGGSGE